MNNRPARIVATIVATIITTFNVSAQNVHQLSLDEAIRLSLQHSSQLKLSRIRVDEAQATAKAAREQRLPNASVSGSYLRLNQPNIDLKIKTGGSQGSGETQSSTPAVDQAAYVLANVSVPVFSGFRIQNAIASAQYLEHASQLDAEKDQEEMVANTIDAYSNLYKAKAALDLVRENLKGAEQRVKDFSNLEKNGLMPRNDLLKTELQQSNVELTLLDALNNWQLTSISMNLMMGLPENTELVPDTTSFKQLDEIHSYDEWESLALQNRKDAGALDYRRRAAAAAVKSAKGEYYPSLSVTAGYIAAHIPGLLTITNAVNAGVGLSYVPSSLWKTGSKVAQAKARLNEIEVNRDLLTDAIRLQVARAYQDCLSAQKKIEVYAKALEQANENYRIVKNKYDNSLATTTELLDADLAQLQSRLNYAFAKADAVVSVKKLQQAAGLINGVSVTEINQNNFKQ